MSCKWDRAKCFVISHSRVSRSKAWAWGQLNLLTVSSLAVFTAREKEEGSNTDSRSETWAKLILLWQPSYVCSGPFFFPESRQGFERRSPALSVRGKQRRGIGWGRLMPLVKWCWHAEELLWEVVIHHDFRMTQSSTLLLGLWSGIHDWCQVDVCVGGSSEKETACICLLKINNDLLVVKT